VRVRSRAYIRLVSLSHWPIYFLYGPTPSRFTFLIGPFTSFMDQHLLVSPFSLVYFLSFWANIPLAPLSHCPIYSLFEPTSSCLPLRFNVTLPWLLRWNGKPLVRIPQFKSIKKQAINIARISSFSFKPNTVKIDPALRVDQCLLDALIAFQLGHIFIQRKHLIVFQYSFFYYIELFHPFFWVGYRF
jgi:hypothetical protein